MITARPLPPNADRRMLSTENLYHLCNSWRHGSEPDELIASRFDRMDGENFIYRVVASVSQATLDMLELDELPYFYAMYVTVFPSDDCYAHRDYSEETRYETLESALTAERMVL